MKINLDNKTLEDSYGGNAMGGTCGREKSSGVFVYY